MADLVEKLKEIGFNSYEAKVYIALLKKHPATDPFGKENNYPIPWAYINGNIFHALCLKYHKDISFSKKIIPSFENYR